MEITPGEASEVGALICSTALGWPPPILKPEDVIVLSGYPKMYRQQRGRQISVPALSAVFDVTASGEYHLVSQWNRDDIVSIGSGEVPPPGADLGGMSGGPVFLVQELVYPLIGITTDFSSELELLRMAHIGALPLRG